MFNLKQYDWKRLNISLIITIIVLCMISIVTIYLGKPEFFTKQVMGVVGGILIILIVSLIDYHFICQFVSIFYFIVVGLLVLVRFSPLGTDLTTGSYRWIKLGIQIQPSEFAKVVLILSLAVLLTRMQEKMDKFYVFFLAAFVTLVPTVLILIQTNLSTGLVMMFIFSIMIFTAGLSYKIIIAVFSIVVPVGFGSIWYVLSTGKTLLFLQQYQLKRIFGFLSKEDVNSELVKKIMYQQNHSVSAISSGRVYGKLILEGPSDIRSYRTVGVRESDFVFSIIGEEFGFIGSCFIIILLLIVIIKCLMSARKASDRLGMLIAIGISSMLMFQVFANVGVATKILPNTGLPLPFLSYGLSSLLSYMICIGIILNIGIQKNLRR